MTDILFTRNVSRKHPLHSIAYGVDPENEFYIAQVLAGNAIILGDSDASGSSAEAAEETETPATGDEGILADHPGLVNADDLSHGNWFEVDRPGGE